MEIKIMPDKHIPPDWSTYAFYMLFIIIAGMLGAFLRQIKRPPTHWAQRICELIGGGICAAYGAELVAQILFHLMKKSDLIHPDFFDVQKLIGLSGMICGAFGMSLIESIIEIIKKYTETNK